MILNPIDNYKTECMYVSLGGSPAQVLSVHCCFSAWQMFNASSDHSVVLLLPPSIHLFYVLIKANICRFAQKEQQC